MCSEQEWPAAGGSLRGRTNWSNQMEEIMQYKLLNALLLIALAAAFAPAAVATTWYVDGVSGSDGNNCTSATTACKTIAHAVEAAVSGDSIIVAPATYNENLSINKS